MDDVAYAVVPPKGHESPRDEGAHEELDNTKPKTGAHEELDNTQPNAGAADVAGNIEELSEAADATRGKTPTESVMDSTITPMTTSSGNFQGESSSATQNWDAMDQAELDNKAEEALGVLAEVGDAERILRLLLKRLGADAADQFQREQLQREQHMLEIGRLNELYDQTSLSLSDANREKNLLMHVLNIQYHMQRTGNYLYFYLSPFVDLDKYPELMLAFAFGGWRGSLQLLRCERMEEQKIAATTELTKTQEAHRIQSEVLSKEKAKNKELDEKFTQEVKSRKETERQLQMTTQKAADFEAKATKAQADAKQAKEEAEATARKAKEEAEAAIAESKAEIARVTETLKQEHQKQMEESEKQFKETLFKKENDMKVMKKQIQQISQELGEAISSASDLRETLKNERKQFQELMSTSSPAALSKLMGDLDALKLKLEALGDLKKEKDFFKRKLDQNVRRLMLERQFLPLIHGVGEFAPPGEVLLGTPAKDKMGEPKKLRSGHSMGALRGGGGRPLTDSR